MHEYSVMCLLTTTITTTTTFVNCQGELQSSQRRKRCINNDNVLFLPIDASTVNLCTTHLVPGTLMGHSYYLKTIPQ